MHPQDCHNPPLPRRLIVLAALSLGACSKTASPPTEFGVNVTVDATAIDVNVRSTITTATLTVVKAGTPPVVNCYAAEAGLKIVLEAGTDAIEQRVRALTRRCMDGLAAIGWPAATPADDARRGPMVAVPSRDAAGLFAQLLGEDIVTSFRSGNIRATVHFYNSDEDIDRFVAAMAAHRPRFGPQAAG